ncbi:hypothetical protein Y032_0030g2196 [Ancylostoma ceylanicum]|nr:hypothetical protein Y032_0030g2196 [Ancylostoma ceylanicum]
MLFTYTFTYVTFFAYPAIGIRAPEAYVVTVVVFMLNCGSNAIIYLVMNKENYTIVSKNIHDHHLIKVGNSYRSGDASLVTAPVCLQHDYLAKCRANTKSGSSAENTKKRSSGETTKESS